MLQCPRMNDSCKCGHGSAVHGQFFLYYLLYRDLCYMEKREEKQPQPGKERCGDIYVARTKRKMRVVICNVRKEHTHRKKSLACSRKINTNGPPFYNSRPLVTSQCKADRRLRTQTRRADVQGIDRGGSQTKLQCRRGETGRGTPVEPWARRPQTPPGKSCTRHRRRSPFPSPRTCTCPFYEALAAELERRRRAQGCHTCCATGCTP